MKKISLIMAIVILLSAFFPFPAYAVYDPLFDAEVTEIDGVKFWYRIIENKYAEIVWGNHFIPETIDGYTVTIIGKDSFWNLYDPDGGDYEVKDWVIPNTVTYIGDGAFNRNPELGTVKIPSNVVYIGESAFSNCINLKEINIPKSVKKIEPYTFF